MPGLPVVLVIGLHQDSSQLERWSAVLVLEREAMGAGNDDEQ